MPTLPTDLAPSNVEAARYGTRLLNETNVLRAIVPEDNGLLHIAVRNMHSLADSLAHFGWTTHQQRVFLDSLRTALAHTSNTTVIDRILAIYRTYLIWDNFSE